MGHIVSHVSHCTTQRSEVCKKLRVYQENRLGLMNALSFSAPLRTLLLRIQGIADSKMSFEWMEIYSCNSQWYLSAFKNGPIPASFLLIFGIFKQTIQFLQQITVKISCPSSIWCWDKNPRSSERESPPITTRPGLPPNIFRLLLL